MRVYDTELVGGNELRCERFPLDPARCSVSPGDLFRTEDFPDGRPPGRHAADPGNGILLRAVVVMKLALPALSAVCSRFEFVRQTRRGRCR